MHSGCILRRTQIARNISNANGMANLAQQSPGVQSQSQSPGPGLHRLGLVGTRTLVPIEGGPHAANMTHAEPVNKAIVQFLAALD